MNGNVTEKQEFNTAKAWVEEWPASLLDAQKQIAIIKERCVFAGEEFKEYLTSKDLMHFQAYGDETERKLYRVKEKLEKLSVQDANQQVLKELMVVQTLKKIVAIREKIEIYIGAFFIYDSEEKMLKKIDDLGSHDPHLNFCEERQCLEKMKEKTIHLLADDLQEEQMPLLKRQLRELQTVERKIEQKQVYSL